MSRSSFITKNKRYIQSTTLHEPVPITVSTDLSLPLLGASLNLKGWSPGGGLTSSTGVSEGRIPVWSTGILPPRLTSWLPHCTKTPASSPFSYFILICSSWLPNMAVVLASLVRLLICCRFVDVGINMGGRQDENMRYWDFYVKYRYYLHKQWYEYGH